VTEIADERLGGIRLLLKRDDLLHPEVPGNKWRKLKYNLAAAREQGHGTLLTFGGAYSNHLRATAAAGRLLGLRTVGVVRGERHLPLNPVLSACVRDGMTLTYLDRATYRRQRDPDVVAALRAAWGPFYLLPEGGSNALAVRGCAELGAEVGAAADVVCCPVGTGGTLAGLAAGLPAGGRALGFAVLKGATFLDGEVRRLQAAAGVGDSGNWSLEHGYHFGGYAKTTPQLLAFAADFTARHGIVADRVYVAKMLAGIYDLAAAGRFAPGATVLAVKTG